MKKIYLLIIVVLAFLSCTTKTDGYLGDPVPFDINNSVYDLSGNITNTTNRPVNQATVKLYVSGQSAPKYTVLSDANGKYQFSGVQEGIYKMIIDAQGYNEHISNIDINATGTKNIQLLGSANISGTIINSQTGLGLASAMVSFTLDHSATTGANAEIQVITDQSGNFSISNLPTGTFIGIIEASGYFTRIIDNITFIQGQIQLTPQTIVQQPVTNSIRMILTWGSSPSDLDTHFTGPSTDGNRFHIYYGNKSPSGAGATLDVDDTSSFGPETVTIQTLVDGTYRYSVHNYSVQSSTGGSGIAGSPAKVEVYDHLGLLKSYTAPAFTGSGNTWRVFEMVVSGTKITLNPINTYVLATGSTDTATFVKKSTDSASSDSKNNKKMTNFNIGEW